MRDNKKKIFIEALEQRIMLDGAGASTALDVIDERNKEQLLNKNQKISKLSENKIEDNSQKLPFDQLVRDQKRNDRKQVVFIDSQVQDYQTLIDAFNEDTEVYLIQSNEDGFKKIDKVLKNDADISSLHIIGHGSAGKILFGNATLSNDTIKSYNQTLRSIGQSLTDDGDILFYGCNVASTEGGKILINKISEITKADIAASDDVTGKSGDWKLEIKVGHIDTKNINHTDYQHDLAMYRTASADTHAAEVTVGVDGITSIRGAMAAFTGTADRNAYDFKSSRDHNPNNSNQWQNYYMTYNSGTFGAGGKNHSDNVGRFTVVLEKSGITSGSGLVARRPANPFDNDKTESQWDSNSGYTYRRLINDGNFNHYKLQATRSSPDADEGPMDVYMVALDAHFGANNDRYNKIAEVKFDREIIGILKDTNQTLKLSSNTANIDMHNSNNNTYPTSNSNSNRSFETIYWRVFNNDYTDTDTWGYGTDFNGGDWFAVGGTDNRTLHIGAKNTGGGDYARILVKGEVASNNAPTASNSTVYINENNQVSSAGDRTPSNITKIFATSDFNFSDSDGDSLSKIQITTLESAGALEYYNGSSWTDVTSNQEITAADIGNNYLRFTPAANSESDVTFSFKVHDGTEYSSSAYTMTISVNAAPNVSDATDTVDAGDDATGDVHDDVADSDDADSVLVVTGVASGNESSNNTIVTDGTGVGSSVSGTYGSLNIAANGTYTYTANATNNIAAGGTANDIFTFTTRDDETNAGSFAYDVGTITFTVSSSIALVNDTDVVLEDETVTHLTNSQGTVISDDTADTDGLVVTNISHTNGNSDTIESGSTYTDSGGEPGIVVGTYGTLTIGADGTYTYTADQSAADALDAGDVVTDVFTYTADGATATLTITVTGVNDDPVAQNDEGVIVEEGTLTVANSANANQSGGIDATGEHSGDVIDTSSSTHTDSDADASASLTITQIKKSGGTNSSVSAGSSYNSSGTSVVGTYGTLTIGADGSYSYVANSATSTLDAGDSVTDVFVYTLSDGTATTTANITITILGANNKPTAGNETVYINENNTDATHGARTSLNIRKDFADSDFTNYSDVDADDNSVGIKIKSLPSSGTLTKINNGAALSVNDTVTNISNLRYTPDANSEADDSFTYKAYDGTVVGDNERTITISVNAAPVAVNDTGSITAGDDDATGNVLTNDTDSDDASSALGIRGVGAGAEGSTLANSNVGSAVSGTYGNLTIGSAGAYTYSVTGNAATIALREGETATDVFSYKVMDDETNAGSKAIDIGTITFTVTGIDGDATDEPNPDEVKKPKKEKREEKRQKREEDRQLKKLKREKRLERKELKIPKSKLAKNAEFNQGLKLVDLVAESNSLELKDKDMDIYVDKIIAKHSDKALKVKFKVFNDEGKEVQKYYGEMKDGSALPDWIKIDPKTGKTKTDIPKGMKMVEFKIIAVDVDNNKKQVTVIIDSKKIAEDKEILKQSRKIERANKLEVKNDGAVKLNSINEEGKIDKTKTEVINKIENIDKLIKTIEPNEFLNLEAKAEKENFEVELPWQNLKVVLNNGQELPQWIKYDPKTGKVTATPPENVQSINLKVIVENPDGELSIKDIKLDFVNENAQETKNIIENETKFVSLSSQLSKEYSDWENYGSQLIDRL